jgi:DNA polymerase
LTCGIETTLADSAEFFFEDVIWMLSNCIRGSFIAAPGKKLVVADLANIEGRIAAWLCGEMWKLGAFSDYDTIIGVDEKGKPLRKGADLYNTAYAKAFSIAVEDVDKVMRQIGKIMELAFSFGGGAGAFATFALVFGVDLDDMADKAIAGIPMKTLKESESFMDWLAGKEEEQIKKEHEKRAKGIEEFGEAKTVATKRGAFKRGLSDKAYIVCNAFKILWRESHSNVKTHWWEIDTAFRDAILSPGEVIRTRMLKFQCVKGWVRIRLPSGAYLVYPQARIEKNGDLTFSGKNQFTQKWERIKTAGPKLFENCVQATARDVFYSSMQPAEDAGYPIVLHVHDELICETPDTDEFTVEGLCQIMSTVPSWAPGLPLAAAGYSAYRYKKE